MKILAGEQDGLGAARPPRGGQRLLLAARELHPVPGGHPAGKKFTVAISTEKPTLTRGRQDA